MRDFRIGDDHGRGFRGQLGVLLWAALIGSTVYALGASVLPWFTAYPSDVGDFAAWLATCYFAWCLVDELDSRGRFMAHPDPAHDSGWDGEPRRLYRDGMGLDPEVYRSDGTKYETDDEFPWEKTELIEGPPIHDCFKESSSDRSHTV